GLVGFGTNLVMAQADPEGSRKTLAALDFFVHGDLFMTPTAELADIVLPIASCFEREALRIGFEIDEAAQSLVQFRHAIVPPPGEARSDTDVVFDLAVRLGLGADFWDGDVEAAYRQQLAPSGIGIEQLRAAPEGIRVPLATRHRKHADPDAKGNPKGFATRSRKVELWSEEFLDHGHGALPDFAEPALGPVARPDLASRFPLVLTCAKPSLFCQTQHRALPSLRKRAPHPEVELHPATAAARGIAAGAWVRVETPRGAMRVRARLNEALDPRVVVGEHGWWQSCAELGEPGYPMYGAGNANFNATVDATVRDPISGTPSHRANLCEVTPAP
ncbi:MAG: molybdopterin dinucleotide binding domain-containing protein, partial [Alphaproteobacteria bacterium]